MLYLVLVGAEAGAAAGFDSVFAGVAAGFDSELLLSDFVFFPVELE